MKKSEKNLFRRSLKDNHEMSPTKNKFIKNYKPIFFKKVIKDDEAVTKCQQIKIKRIYFLDFCLKMYEYDFSTFTNYQDDEDIHKPNRREVPISWIKHSKMLSRFQVFLHDDFVLDQSPKYLLQKALKYLKSIKLFTLYLSGNDVNFSLIESLCISMQNKKHVKSLGFDISNSRVNDEAISMFVKKILRRMVLLEKVDLGLGGNPLTDRSMNCILHQGLKNFKIIRELELCLWRSGITDETLVSLTDKLSKDNNIQILHLFFGTTAITNEGFETFSNDCLSQLRNLKSLELGLGQMQIRDGAIVALSKKALINMEKLERFSINVITNDLTGKSMSVLSEYGLNKLKELKDLKLSFDSVVLSQDSLLKLANRGLPSLQKLRYLVLDFIDCPYLSDVFLLEFGLKGLSKMKHLELLRFCTRENSRITDAGLKDFTEYGLRKLKNLKRLILGIGGTRVTDKGFSFFCQNGLANLKNLEEIQLFIWGIRITDQSFKIMSEDGLSKMKNLTFVKLLAGDNNLTRASIETLLQNLKKLRMMKKLSLEINSALGNIFQEDYPFKINTYLVHPDNI